MRPKHWLKNILVLVPLIFSGRFIEPPLDVRAFLAFIAFSLAASIIYIINDINDVEKDRKHPTKCKRPIASGRVTVTASKHFAAFLALITIALHAWLGTVPLLLIGVYAAMNIAYSCGLKTIPLVDITILAAGYIIRLYYGALVCGVTISSWLYLTTLAGSFYLGLGKRRGELDRSGSVSRRVLEYYSRPFLDKNMHIYMGLTIAFYALWAREQGNAMLWTVLLVMLIFMRYSLDIEGSSDADPMEVITKDHILLALASLYIVITAGIIYIPRLVS
jgi:4-hydroxybenzoate polyprenyltransferase